VTTFCPHGVSHQPGEPSEDGRSQWCGECYPELTDTDALVARSDANALDALKRALDR
jgi:hypothetical protein